MKTRKLLGIKGFIPAVAMVLASATMLGGVSYAWFSMNTSVSATGMQVTAKSDNTFLLIGTGNDDTASEIQTANAITTALTVSDGEAKVYPSAPAGAATYTYAKTTDTTLDSGKTYYTYTATEKEFAEVTPPDVNDIATYYERTTLTQVSNVTTAADFGNWYTASGKSAQSTGYIADEGTVKALTTFTGYVITKTVYLTVALGANAAKNLSVTAAITQKTSGSDIDATKILVTTDDGGFATLSNTTSTADIKGTNTNITDSTVRTVNIYIYYDGNDDSVYTNNAVNLTGTDITLSFAVTAVPAAQSQKNTLISQGLCLHICSIN